MDPSYLERRIDPPRVINLASRLISASKSSMRARSVVSSTEGCNMVEDGMQSEVYGGHNDDDDVDDDSDGDDDDRDQDDIVDPSQAATLTQSSSLQLKVGGGESGDVPMRDVDDVDNNDEGDEEDKNSAACTLVTTTQQDHFTTSPLEQRFLSRPFKSSDGYRKLSQVMRVLQSIQMAQHEGVYRQIRRVFYEDKELFKTQQTVCNIVNLLEDYWQAPSSHFNLLPAHKGLFAGPIGISVRDDRLSWKINEKGEWQSANATPSPAVHTTCGVNLTGKAENQAVGTANNTLSGDAFSYKEELISDPSRIARMLPKPDDAVICWVLVVEKETCFADRVQELNRYIAENSPAMASHGQGIILTAKGMPDMATRRWLEVLAQTLPSVPFYALMDGGERNQVLRAEGISCQIDDHDSAHYEDAYGMHIYHIYCSFIRHYPGTKQVIGQRLKWIGLKPSETLDVLETFSFSGERSTDGSGAVLIDLNERNKALFLAKNPDTTQEIQLEALRLMTYGYKLELEAVAKRPLYTLMPLPATIPLTG